MDYYKYLRPDQYYADLYDLLTIKECLRYEEGFLNTDLSTYKEAKNFSPERAKAFKKGMADFSLYFIKGENYRNKQPQINKWMDRDRFLDEKLEGTPEPPAPFCNKCGTRTVAETKNIENILADTIRILFFFECKNCVARKLLYDNGNEYVSKLEICPQCGGKLTIKFSKKKNILTTKRGCTSCSFKDVDVDDTNVREKEWAEKEDLDKKLLVRYRSVFCLSKEEGDKYLFQIGQFEALKNMSDEKERKQADPNYQKAMALKKLTVAELEKLLIPILEKQNYTKLFIDKPEMSRYIALPFSVQDSDTSRAEYDSVHQLQKLLKKTLGDINWRLMSNGVSYRLGILQGRLRAYETDEDLVNLVRT